MKKKPIKSEYEIQADDFLTKTGVRMTANFLYLGKHFDSDEQERNIYQITLHRPLSINDGVERSERSYSFNFGQSLANSGMYHLKRVYENKNPRFDYTIHGIANDRQAPIKPPYTRSQWRWEKNPNFAEPNAYDVLAGIQKYEPEAIFDDFCQEFGYEFECEADYLNARKTHTAVHKEWQEVRRLWNEEFLEELQEIN